MPTMDSTRPGTSSWAWPPRSPSRPATQRPPVAVAGWTSSATRHDPARAVGERQRQVRHHDAGGGGGGREDRRPGAGGRRDAGWRGHRGAPSPPRRGAGSHGHGHHREQRRRGGEHEDRCEPPVRGRPGAERQREQRRHAAHQTDQRQPFAATGIGDQLRGQRAARSDGDREADAADRLTAKIAGERRGGQQRQRGRAEQREPDGERPAVADPRATNRGVASSPATVATSSAPFASRPRGRARRGGVQRDRRQRQVEADRARHDRDEAQQQRRG